MPLYEYKCLKCGRNTEKIESLSGPHLKKCPHCGGKVESVLSAPAIQFKGAGWYVTDYGGKKSSASDGDKADKPAIETKESKETAGKETSPKDTAAKDGAAKDSAAKDGAAKDGAAKDGAAKDGAAKDGAAKDGAAKGGAKAEADAEQTRAADASEDAAAAKAAAEDPGSGA